MMAINEPSQADVSVRLVIAASADLLYDMISDVARMGEWSPSCSGCVWDQSASGRPGDWFIGLNDSGSGSHYETRNQVLVADRPTEFSWIAGGLEEGWAIWAYRIAALDERGTEVVESWTLIRQYHQADPEHIDQLRELTRQRIAATLTNLKAVAEASIDPR
jgi:uncharacterized protein YndB with AHSA1/START domain